VTRKAKVSDRDVGGVVRLDRFSINVHKFFVDWPSISFHLGQALGENARNSYGGKKTNGMNTESKDLGSKAVQTTRDAVKSWELAGASD